MLKRMLGIDPAEIKSHIEELANAASGMHSEQKRIAEFQNLLANNALKQNEQLARIIHDDANVSQGLMAIVDILAQHEANEVVRHQNVLMIYELLERTSKRTENELATLRDDHVAMDNHRLIPTTQGVQDEQATD